MTTLYTIGFTQRTASDFFGTLKRASIPQLVDVRLNNVSQLSGFAKRADLEYFLKEICNATYLHETRLAPLPQHLEAYRSKGMSWDEYAAAYVRLLEERGVERAIEPFESRTVLLCSERTAERCHRRLAAEYLARAWGDVEIVHL